MQRVTGAQRLVVRDGHTLEVTRVLEMLTLTWEGLGRRTESSQGRGEHLQGACKDVLGQTYRLLSPHPVPGRDCGLC
jgi:hypothetical protein